MWVRTMSQIRTYHELLLLQTRDERFEYLKQIPRMGETSLGYDRRFKQAFYQSREWQQIRDWVIVRDGANDLGVEGYPINGTIFIHHLNPITLGDIENHSPMLLDPMNLICCSKATHEAIHYGDKNLLVQPYTGRRPNDTSPWKGH